MHRLQWSPLVVCLALLGCGGGDSGDPASAPATPTSPGTPAPAGPKFTAGTFAASSTFAAQCQTPRSGTDPSTGRAYPDVAGSALLEKFFLRSWTNELYLWFSEVPDRDPAATAAVADYFNLLKTPAVLSSGIAKDQFHFTYDSADFDALSQSGTSLGYGIAWDIVVSLPPRRVVVQYVQAGSPAALAGVTRGSQLQTIDGVDVVNDDTQAGVNAINAAVFSPASGSSHALVFRSHSGTMFTATLAAASVTFNPVPVTRVLPTATGNLGYLLFNDHTASAEQALINAVNQLAASNVQDLVLDLRYNGGGYVDIASELAYMIAGSARTSGKTFELQQFSSKYPNTNPVEGGPLQPVDFHATRQFSSAGTALPTLNLPRLYVLTSPDTCSASESIINSLRGVGVQVYQIGGDTCGKPYGFYPRDNCGTTYFSIQFKGVNQLGFGDYAEGFSATRVGGDPQAKLPGCAAAEDYAHDLGDPAEERLRVAMEYRNFGICTGTAMAMESAEPLVGPGVPLLPPVEPWRHNRFLRP